MDYEGTLNYIHSLERFGVKPGLERILKLCEAAGNPQKDMKFIHIAGTNGKGSTCTMISNMLIAAGYKTGLYISPYITDFRERIQLSGSMISKEDLISCVETIKEIRETSVKDATEFEVITAAAFLYFKMKECDYVVLEVGLGGRFDATNVIEKPEVSVIASVSFDHQAVLGNTLEEIAYEKCGIIKENSPVVSYPLQRQEAASVISETCKSKNSPLILPDLKALEILDSGLNGTKAKYKNIQFNLHLAGEHMVYNAVTAIEAVRTAVPGISDEDIMKGIENTVMPARLETVSENPLVILEGGHNEDCALALHSFITKNLSRKKIIAVCSMMEDKEYEKYLSIVLPDVTKTVICRVDMARAAKCSELAAAAGKYCNDIVIIENSARAVKYALNEAENFDAVLICGSFYLAGEVRNIFEEENNE